MSDMVLARNSTAPTPCNWSFQNHPPRFRVGNARSDDDDGNAVLARLSDIAGCYLLKVTWPVCVAKAEIVPTHAGVHVVLIVPDNEVALAVSRPLAVIAHVLSVGLIAVNAPAGTETLTVQVDHRRIGRQQRVLEAELLPGGTPRHRSSRW